MLVMSAFFYALCLYSPEGFENSEGFNYGKENKDA